jgi:hypothetical protein
MKEKMLLYKDAVAASPEGISPVSATWAKKHILNFSDEEIKLDLQQQRIERAVGAELLNTATIITHTGVFDNIDKLYGNKKPGSPEAATSTPPPGPEGGAPEGGGGLEGEMPPPPPGPPPGGPAGITPESFQKDNLKILLESENLTDDDSFIDLSRGKNQLGEMSNELNRILGD